MQRASPGARGSGRSQGTGHGEKLEPLASVGRFQTEDSVPRVLRGSKLGGRLEPADAATLAWEESW